MSAPMNGAEAAVARIPIRKLVVTLRRVMDITFQTLRAYLPSTERFDRLLEIGWEDTGGLFLAFGAIAVMTLVGAIRSR